MGNFDIKNIWNAALRFIFEYKMLSVLFAVIIVLLISSFNFNGKIGLKKNKNLWYLKTSKHLVKLIDRIKFLSKVRDVLTRDLALLTHKNKSTNRIIANDIIGGFIAVTLGVTVLSVIFIKYAILKLLVPVIFLSAVVMIFTHEFSSRRKKAQKDFCNVVKIYTSQYAKYNNVYKAFQGSIINIPDTHKYEFSRLISNMGSSTGYIDSLKEYADRINDTMCYLFVEILITGYVRNDNVLLALIDLEQYIADDKKNDKIRHNKLNDKKINIYLGIGAIIGAILINNSVLLGEYSKNLYFNSFVGQVFLLVCVLVVTVVLLVLSILNKLL